MTIQELQQLIEESKKAIPNNPVLSSRQPALPPDRSTISARHPYEVTLPYNQIGPFPSNMSAGAPRGEVAYDPRSYAKEAVMNLPTALQIGPVFHGSPYKFTKFKNEAIGTGEGVQAFGYGHYLSESQGVAESYRKGGFKIGGQKIDTSGKDWFPEYFDGLDGLSAEEQLKVLSKDLKQVKEAGAVEDINFLSPIVDRLRKGEKIVQGEGPLYEATLHKGKKPGEYMYLDWDKRVSDEILGKIRTKFKDLGFDESLLDDLIAREKRYPDAMKGSSFYNGLGNYIAEALNRKAGSEIFRGSDKMASEFLKGAGIDGIKYPAGSLSGMKSDKFNYVVFDPEDIAIEGVK